MPSTQMTCYCSIVFAAVATFYTVQAKLVDLSHDVDKNTVMAVADWPRYKTQIVYEQELTPGVYAKAMSYSVSEHGGTHIDAPNHFNKDGYSVEQIPLASTIADGVMIDCTKETNKDPNYSLTLQKIKDWEKEHGKIPPNFAVVLNYNWSHKFTNASLYLNPLDPTNLTDPSTYRFPTVTKEAIDFLVDERDINILAMDTMSPDLLMTKYTVHVKLSAKNKLLVENVKDPGLLPAKGFRFHASPSKFVGSTGVQTRVYAIIDEDCGNGGGQIMGYPLLATLSVLIVTLFLRLFAINV